METQTSLTERTYEVLMAIRSRKLTADEGREQLSALKAEAGSDWEAVKNAAVIFDIRNN